ncbi:peptidase domain-containing ABC transporter [Parafilimonas sp.]|uniref:peptidase domain-containing ABC transporter n=1 Tax=Parafilimonas sp. TaxID=1969739 RepID=UPI0039E4C6EC
MKFNRFPLYLQLDAMDCGPTCLKMIAKFYGKNISLNRLRTDSQFSKEGVSLLGISKAAEKIGFRTQGVTLTHKQLTEEVPLPIILHWRQNHFVVLTPFQQKEYFEIADPAAGLVKMTEKEFKAQWLQAEEDGESIGIALILEPTHAFYVQEDEKEVKVGWTVLLFYLKQNRRFISQLFIGLFIGSLLQLIFPFLTQSIVDVGINTHDLQFIYIILIAQCMLFISRTVVDFIRSRILLYVSTRINISLLSDFWSKLMRLPLAFFDTKQTGDILQRIEDQHRIENFLTGTALSTMFSFINIIVFSIVLLLYKVSVFFVFAIGSIFYVLWIRFFLKRRRDLDYKRFFLASRENSTTMQLIYGMQEIKLNNAETAYRWEWENLQARLFNLLFKNLSLSQWQQAGAVFINEGKNIFITFLVATAVLNGQLTLGAMLAIQYIIGQLNSPVEQLVGFVQQAQDAKISLERLNEIYQVEDEEKDDSASLNHGWNEGLINPITINKGIKIQDLSFRYTGVGNEPVLKNIKCEIPEGKVTAIVGVSGSGKTTLLKLLLKFYENYKGEITVGGVNLKYISPSYWRSQCGSVLQEGYIFNKSIAQNITINDENLRHEKLIHACKMANILPFVESLPLGFNTKIGAEGNGISAGQKQRILIARAVYKNPQYLFFDEATNALDANNEKVIIENLQNFFNGKTVVVAAHRLSTVKNADNIIVLHEGEIAEQGTHEELSSRKKRYYELVRNQLDLGN